MALRSLHTDRVGGPTLGVLGGMGPAATAEFLRVFTASWPADRDQDHPRLIMLSEPAIPDRSAALRAAQSDPSSMIRRALRLLARWGADVVAVPCNTAFAFIDAVADHVGIPVIDTVGETVARARLTAPGGAWLLATEGTIAARLYQLRAKGCLYPFHLPNEAEQAAVGRIVQGIKSGRLAEAECLFSELTVKLSNQYDAPLVLGCTELSLVRQAAKGNAGVVDSVEALAVACVRNLAQVVGNRVG